MKAVHLQMVSWENRSPAVVLQEPLQPEAVPAEDEREPDSVIPDYHCLWTNPFLYYPPAFVKQHRTAEAEIPGRMCLSDILLVLHGVPLFRFAKPRHIGTA